MICERCNTETATTRMEHRHAGDFETWPNQVTYRCDDCARQLREYAKLPNIGLIIVEDERLGFHDDEVGPEGAEEHR